MGFPSSMTRSIIEAMKTKSFRPSNSIFVAGFSLLEVLISIIILSFGLLGVVGLQAASLKANREAVYQSSATRLGREIGEMMEGNRKIGVLTTAADNPYLFAFDSSTDTVAVATPITTNCWTGDCYTTNTTATQKTIAQWQAQDWLYRLNEEIPGARVTICFDETPYDGAGLPQWTCTNSGTVAVIKIGWTRASTNSAPASAASAFDRASKPATVLPVTL